jgi:hypothetical protein
MSLQHTIRTSIAVVAIWLACWPAAAAPIDDLIPTDVALAVVTDNLSATAAAWERTRWGAALSGMAFDPLRRELRSRDLATPLHLRPWFGVDWAELANWQGPVALIVFGDGKAAYSALLFPTSTGGDPSPLAGAMSRYLTTKRLTRNEGMASGFRVVSGRLPVGDQPASGPASLASDRLFAIANNRSAALHLARVLASDEFKPLSSQSEYRESTASAAEVAGAQRIRFWIRPLPLWTLARLGDAGQRRPDWLAIGQRQGFDAVRSVSGIAEFREAGASEIELRGKVAITSPLTKAARLLELKSGPAPEIPQWLAGEFASLSLWQCDFPVAITSFGLIFDELAEPGPSGQGLFKDLLDGLRDDPEGPRVDLRREVFPHLGPQVLSVVDRPASAETEAAQPAGGNSSPSGSLLVFQCRNSAAVKMALTRFYKSDEEVRHELLGADSLWTIGPGKSLFVEGGGESQMQVRAVLVTNDALLAASHPETLSRRVRAGTASKLDRGELFPTWIRWQSDVATGQTSYRGAIMEESLLERAYAQVQGAQPMTTEEWQVRALRFLLWGSASSQPDVDASALPAWSDVRSALGATGLTLDVSPTGFVLRGAVLRQSRPAP